MEKVDFCTVMKKIIGHCRENIICDKNKDKKYGQFELVVDIFSEHYTSSENIKYDSSAVSRWIKGYRAVSGEIINYYRENGSEGISDSFKDNCLKNIYDLEGLYSELLSLIRNDYTLSEEKKSELSFYGDKANEMEICDFIGMLIFDAIDRPFVPANKPMLPTSTIAVSECVFGAEVPSPCRYFCGRDTEIDNLHADIMKYQKVFITGFAGIGKSEFAKAYVKKFKKEYRNILYFNYHGSLKEMITDIDFIGDSDSDNKEISFTKHLRFLKSLRPDSLIIIDNFNISGTGDSFLVTLLKFSCKIIFTTRSNVDMGHFFKLDIIESADELYNFVGKYYSYSDENKEKIYALIEAVHQHTLSVEMIAKLLEKGLHSAEEILSHLQMNSADPESNDKIKVIKDGANTRATYYNHIRSLFSLYLLDDNYQTIIRSMVFAENVRISYLAKLLNLNDTNTINELCDLGFTLNNQADIISLHPMIRDVAVLDLKPSFENCRTFFTSIKKKILVIGKELPDSKIIISVIETTLQYVDKNNKSDYLIFLEDSFTFLDNYKELDLMEIIISETENILENEEAENTNDRALLYNNKAMLLRNRNEKIPHAISLMNKALSLCDRNENPVLYANINMNLGLLYADNNDKRGLEFMDKAYIFIKLCRGYNNDFITIARNYATSLADTSMNKKALEVLTECEFASEGCISVNHARLIYDIGVMCIRMNKIPTAVKKFNAAFSELSELGCYGEISARKIAAARIMQKSGYNYPKEWEDVYLE